MAYGGRPPFCLRAGALFSESWLPVYVRGAFFASLGPSGVRFFETVVKSEGLLWPPAAFCGLLWGIRWGIRRRMRCGMKRVWNEVGNQVEN